MSLMTYLDNTGRFNLSLHNDHPQVTISIIINNSNDLKFQFTNPSMPKLRIFGAFKTELKKLAWIMKVIKNNVHGDILENLVWWIFRFSIAGIGLFAFDYLNIGPDALNWTKFKIPEVKEVHDMLRKFYKEFNHFQEVHSLRNLHGTGIQSTTTILAANSHASNLLRCKMW
ncbi:hypothetical protein HF325_002231 [Metschnikowia pulcherrima]|uniref:Uncharacterized protein n=1 Tax=Metschnikowia pulcherrima TaxID=27326 RepID=A0A8H7GUN4_9ASCO|nr:hypothetical protein HF325_002231 [Metschnikowia pulcherrima]